MTRPGPDEGDPSRRNHEILRRGQVEAGRLVGAVGREGNGGIEPSDPKPHPGSISKVRRCARLAVAAALLVALAAPAFAQAAGDPRAPLPLDPSIRTGTLPNGLTYFIRRNGQPANRVLLRLAVRAGSIDEADDQRGPAHMLEHMAFNGTARFKPGELVSYLESIGARFGPHVNAYTGFDETVYMLNVPTERQGALVRGFEALSDFAGGLTLDAQEIDRERGVVIEEWRGRPGASTRMQAPQMAGLFGASRFTDRVPIGTPENLKQFPRSGCATSIATSTAPTGWP